MIYEVIKDEKTYKVDDTILLKDQPRNFRKVLEELLSNNMIATFDNAVIIVNDFGRVLINYLK